MTQLEPPGKKDIISLLKATALFGVLDDTTLEKMAGLSQWVVLKKGDRLFRQGDRADAVYVLAAGALSVSLAADAPGDGGPDEKIVGRISPVDVVGEIQLLTMGKRTATVTAETDSGLVMFGRRVFDRISVETPAFLASISAIIRKRLFVDRLAEILPVLFGPLSSRNISAIIRMARWVTVKRGEILMRKGDPGNSFYILVDGRLGASLRNRPEGAPDIVSVINRGESIGELALLTEDARSATVHALRDSELVEFSREGFFALLEQYPSLLMQITRMIISRLKRTDAAREEKKQGTVFAVVPAGPDEDLEPFVRKLCRALSRIGPTACIGGPAVEAAMGTPGISRIPAEDASNIRVSAWLTLQEERHDFVLLIADATAGNWTRRCIRQADRILVVGQAGSDPAPGLAETDLIRDDAAMAGVKRTLVLLHPDGSRQPGNTRDWLDKRDVAMHHHVRMDRESDINRLARFMSGTAVGLVLGGGGARGFAHVGALKALREAGIPVDIVCGTSMGAIIAAQYALEWDYDTMVRNNSRDMKKMIFDFTLPLVSLFSGAGLVRELRHFLGDLRIEDLWVPYFCVSSNLTRARVTIHRQGALRRAVQASNAAPGIFPPVRKGRDLLVDGAFLSNLPADALRSVHDGKIIALDVCPPVDLDGDFNYGETVSGWKVLGQILNPFSKQMVIPSIMTILRRSGELASIAGQKRMIERAADRYIHIPVEQYGFQEYNAVQEIIDAGYTHVKNRLSDITEWRIA